MIGIDDFCVIPDASEEILPPGVAPERAVCEIALKKAKNVSQLCEKSDIIIAADTLVYLDGVAISKPEDRADAISILRRLSGRMHSVYTGVAILHDGECVTASERTDVFFREISDDEIAAYVDTGEPMDKAGAYGVQGRAAVFVERREGDFFNVMGLPVCRVSKMLGAFLNK
jgi:septum formation protein